MSVDVPYFCLRVGGGGGRGELPIIDRFNYLGPSLANSRHLASHYFNTQEMYLLGPNLVQSYFRNWSLITRGGGGGYKTGGGRHVKFYPYEKGSGKSFSHAEEEGHNKFWGSFYAVAWKF